MAEVPQKLHVLTLNVWGLLLVSKRRHCRIKELGQYLKSSLHDVVCLQEVWCSGDAKHLVQCGINAGLKYSVHFKSGIFGSGLLTLSRYPIEEQGFVQYSAAGDPMAVHCGDYLAKKGVGWVRVLTPHGALDVYNTHLHANYSHQTKAKCGQWRLPDDAYAPFRLSQILELAQLVRHVSKQGSIGFILCGDLNTKPDFLESGLLRLLLPARHVDVWDELHGQSMDPGHTCRAAGNTFESTRQVPERIDYVLTDLVPSTCEVTLKTCSKGCSYSDHFAVQAQLLFQHRNAPPSPRPPSLPPHTSQTIGEQMLTSPIHAPCTLSARQWGAKGLSLPHSDANGLATSHEAFAPAVPSPHAAGDLSSSPLTLQQVQNNHVICEQVLQCTKRLLGVGVIRCRRQASLRMLLGLFCAVISLTFSAQTALSMGTSYLQVNLLPLGLCQLFTALIAPVFGFCSALLFLMGGVANISQHQALMQTGTEHVVLLMASLNAAKDGLLAHALT